jgi:hypothetical protein
MIYRYINVAPTGLGICRVDVDVTVRVKGHRREGGQKGFLVTMGRIL